MYKLFVFKRSSHKSTHPHMNCYKIRLPSQNNIKSSPQLKFQFYVLFALMKISNFLLILGPHSMDSQGSINRRVLPNRLEHRADFLPPQALNCPLNGNPCRHHHSSKDFHPCLIKCHFFSCIPSCHMLQVLDSRTPPMATLTPPSI